MARYRIAEDCRGTYNHAVLGNIDFEFQAGDVDPRSEQEEIVLAEQLVPAGLAVDLHAPDVDELEAGDGTVTGAAVRTHRAVHAEDLSGGKVDEARAALEALKVGELRELAEARGLESTGRKAELVDRILAADATEAEEAGQ